MVGLVNIGKGELAFSRLFVLKIYVIIIEKEQVNGEIL
jgi:hypothetical protein